MTGENGVPETPDWVVWTRACPIPTCDVCETTQPQGFGTYPHIPPNIVLGDE